MPKQILDKSNMTEQDWQEYRKSQRGLGGSDVATILGLNPYKSAFTLWLEKTGQIEPQDLSENDYVKWGNILEPVLREQFAQITGFEVFENPWVLQHDEHDFMVANIDGELIDPAYGGKRGILEIKTASERMKSEWEVGPPNHYMLQIQHYLSVLNYDYAYVCCLIGGNTFKYFKIERDDYVIDHIISALSDFTQLIEQKIAPDVSGHSSESDYLASAFPSENGEIAELRSDLEVLAIRYKDIQSEVKALEDEANYIKNRIKLEAKEYKVLKSDNVKISMPTINKVSFNSKEFEKDHPELFKEYKNKQSSYRNFTVTLLRKD